jgi:hypothetical protein
MDAIGMSLVASLTVVPALSSLAAPVKNVWLA